MRVHRLGVQKHAKLEKRVCFWSYLQIWKGQDGQIKKNASLCTALLQDDIHPEIQVDPGGRTGYHG